MSNRNALAAQIFVEELARAGLRHVVLAPGSRNTPLVLAFAAHPAITAHSLLDERGGGFFALGLAMATGAPVAVVCTSGSAVANYFPAVVEAHQSRVPLLVLTADRPHELRHSGANQTIDQVKLFGDYALWSIDLGVPEAQPPALSLRHLRTTASRAFATANGLRKGVVHVNFPFRKPLEPTPVVGDLTEPPADATARDLNRPFTRVMRGTLMLPDEPLDMLAVAIETHARGLVVCGTNTPAHARAAIAMLAARCGYPLLADSASGLRWGRDGIVGTYDSFLGALPPNFPTPDIVLRFGDLPTSQALNDYLERAHPTYRVHISGDGTWADDMHRTTHFIHADEKLACMQLFERFEHRSGSAWLRAWRTLEAVTAQALRDTLASAPFHDATAVVALLDALPDEARLFAGNSLPVRHLDQFGVPAPKKLTAYVSRGASGIDGNVSTAFGIAAGSQQPTAALLGDVTLYHDLNGLLAARRLGVPLTLVLLNNNGGGIFHRLPIKDYDPAFTQFFVTPHALDFAHAARLFELDYVAAESREAVSEAVRASTSQRRSALIEVKTDAQHDLAQRRAVMVHVHAQLQAHAWQALKEVTA